MKRCVWLFVILLPMVLQSQHLELGLSNGFSFYSGDISTIHFQNFSNNASPSFGAYLTWKSDAPYSMRFQTNLTSLTANDVESSNAMRMLNFKTKLWEAYAALDLNLFQLVGIKSEKWHPFAFVGYGGFYFNPQALINDDYVDLRPLGTEGQGANGQSDHYRKFESVIPFGGGLKLQVNDQTTIMLELGFRYTFTDHLDDVSNASVDYLEVLENNGILAARLSNPNIDPFEPQAKTYRRGGKYNDWYYMSTISVGFTPKFTKRRCKKNSKLICPKF